MSDTSLRWPGGVVHYLFDYEVSLTDRHTIEDAMHHIQHRTQIRFVEGLSSSDCLLQGGLLITKSDEYDVSSSSYTGLQGMCQLLKFWPGHAQKTAIHELGHVLGLKHEQNRPDRDAWVTIHWANIDSDALNNFEMMSGEDVLDEIEPYDYDSIMHYSRFQFCKKEFDTSAVPWVLRCVGPTMTAVGNPTRDFGNSSLSPGDINTLNLMYANPLGVDEIGDAMGSAVALADFDGDSYSDIVVGAPGEQPGSEPRSGALFAFKGTFKTPVPWRLLTEESPIDDQGTTVAVNEADDQFGSALAVGLFNADEYPDLAVGVPNKAPGSGPRSGGVMLFRGSSRGLRAWRFISLPNLGFIGSENDRFGAALAAVDLGHDGRAELLIGAPGRGNGSVFILRGSSLDNSSPDFTELQQIGTATTSADFGAAITTGDFDGDGVVDVVVGAPRGGTAQGGNIHLFLGDDTLTPNPQQRISSPSPLAGEEFGFALASGWLFGSNRKQLVVGAPKRKQGSVATGAVFVYDRKVGGGGDLERTQTILPGSATDPQRFGHALAYDSYDDDVGAHLAIGAPGFNNNRGRVVIMTVNGSNQLVKLHDVIPNFSLALPAPKFGTSIATGIMRVDPGLLPPSDFTENPSLFVGCPGDGANSPWIAAGSALGVNVTPSGAFQRVWFHEALSSPWTSDD